MKKKLCILLFASISVYASAQTAHEKPDTLTREQKLNDFEYLYQTLKDNYPYFGVGLRQTGVDWLAKHDEFAETIKSTDNDSAFIFALKDILKLLGNGHVDMSFILYWKDYTNLYKKVSETDSRYKMWVATLEDSTARPLYWQKMLLNESPPQQKTEEAQTQVQVRRRNDYSDSIILADKIGIMNITTFNMFNIEKDKPRIDSFLNKIKDFEHLIINIQDNGGGATRYWTENIVERLIRDTIVYPQYLVMKNGVLNREFYPAYFENTHTVQKEGTLQHIPDEMLDGSFRMKSEPDTVAPKNSVPFNGKIYLLVNRGVFSSAEGLAYFCKATGWAQVAGTKTGGDGVGSDPIPFILPNSGIIIRYPALSGFNIDGSLNFEECTVPDIVIAGNSSDERLQKLIALIKK
jgi:hypothetical protein